MPFGYGKILNYQMLKNITKPPWIPDFHCMVGTAEFLSPVPVLVPQFSPKSPDAVKDTNDIPYERLKTDIDGKSLTESEFTKSIYLGKPTGGY